MTRLSSRWAYGIIGRAARVAGGRFSRLGEVVTVGEGEDEDIPRIVEFDVDVTEGFIPDGRRRCEKIGQEIKPAKPSITNIRIKTMPRMSFIPGETNKWSLLVDISGSTE
jgi:hypothetical protein